MLSLYMYCSMCIYLNVYIEREREREKRERERYSRWPVGQVHTSYMPTTIYTPRKRKTTPILSPGKNAPLQFNMDTQHCYNCLKQSPVPKHHFWISKSSKFLGCFHHQLLSAGHLALIIAVRLRHIPGIPSCQVLLPVLCVTTTCRTIGSALLPLESVWIQPWVSPWNVSLKADPPWFLQQLSGGAGGWNTFRGQKMEPNRSQNSKICQQKSSTSHFEVPIEFMYEYICLYIRLMFMKICRANIPNMGQNLWRAERFPWQFWPPPELRNGNGQPNELPCKFDWFMRGSVFHGLWNHPYTKPGSDSSPIRSKEPG